MTARRVDANHAEIKAALKAAGVWVADTAAQGDGFPDLVCEYQGRVFLIEVKAGSGRDPDAARRLARCAHDVKARAAWIIGQARGSEPMAAGVTRRGFEQSVDWLPP